MGASLRASERRIHRMTSKTPSARPSCGGKTLGLLQGKLDVPEDFDAPLPAEVQEAFEGGAAGDQSFAAYVDDESAPSLPSMQTWNYRVILFKHGEDAWCAIHEVHYRDGLPIGYGNSPAVACWDAEEGDRAGRSCLDRMREALNKPILSAKDLLGPR